MSTSNDEEVFLSLDDDIEVDVPKSVKKPAQKPRVKKPNKKAKAPPQIIVDAEILDGAMAEHATGTYELGWPLLGMDCPDCASKATRALDTLHQANDVQVSATAGTVRLKVDLQYGHLAEVSSVLR